MEIHLIRHTAVHNPDNVCYGRSDISLVENHIEDFDKVSIDQDYDLVLSSPALRCQSLVQHYNLSYDIDARLSEYNFGNWEQQKWSDIPKDEIEPWYDDFVNIKPPNGEDLLEMQLRVMSVWEELIAKQKYKKVLIITHAGVIRLIFQSILAFPLDKMFNIFVEHGKKNIITVDKKILTIKQINV